MHPDPDGLSNRGPGNRVKAVVRDNGLLLACLILFAIFFVGMIISGWSVYNSEQLEHGDPAQISILDYLTTGDFIEATFENWESEFLQMGMYVVLTAFLYQKGSSESKPTDGSAPQDADPRDAADDLRAPWPVRRGGWTLSLYQNSLAIVFFALFFASIALHALGGARAHSSELEQHGQPAVSVWEYLATSQFWFESMQNWQSEFIAVAAIVGMSVYFRQRSSPESKSVAAPNDQTGA
jgi:cbb3-type cytochrome oxidase subunit 3